jgi:hypothetical protein
MSAGVGRSYLLQRCERSGTQSRASPIGEGREDCKTDAVVRRPEWVQKPRLNLLINWGSVMRLKRKDDDRNRL